MNSLKHANHKRTDLALKDYWFNLAMQIPYDLPFPEDIQGHLTSHEFLGRIYSSECASIELLEGEYHLQTQISIPGAVLDEYRKYRPTPLCRARGLERYLGYPGEIYFKREDMNPTGSHKPNTAIPQAYYAKKQGLKGLVTDTGAGQWGAAISWACRTQGLDCTVFMTRNSFQTKPYRRYLMELSGARVYPSPSEITAQGRALLETDPEHCGSLGIGMGEAMELVRQHPDTRLALGCMSYYAALHQTIIGQELVEQLAQAEIEPDFLIGCVGGGSNFVGFIAPFVPECVRQLGTPSHQKRTPKLVAVESLNVPALTQGTYEYEHADTFALTPRVKMYTLGREFMPSEFHAAGLRYHGKTPILSLLVHHGVVEATAVSEAKAFEAGRVFFACEGILVAPESAHAVAQVISQVESEKQEGTASTIVFCLSGTGYLDLQGYDNFFDLR